MRGLRFRARLWIAGAILGLTLAGACNLNPQPLPPGSDESTSGNGGTAASPSSSSGSGSGASGGSTFTSSSGTGSGGAGSSGAIVGVADAGALAELDASVEDGGDDSTPVEMGDANMGSDGGPDGGSADASLDAGLDASPDAAQDDASTNAGCIRASDCLLSHPGACALCAWPFDSPVCVERVCRCACDARDAAGH